MTPTDYHATLQKLGGVVYAMERTGVPVDLDVCRAIEYEALSDELATRAQLDDYAGRLTGSEETNWGYWGYLAKVLHGPKPAGLGLPPSPFWKKGKVDLGKGEIKTDDRALEWLGWRNPEHRPFLAKLREWRRQRRMKTYAQSFRELAIVHPDGVARLHPSYGMANDADDRPGAKTGRFGIKNPPLQQVPRDKTKDPYRLRRAFVSTPGRVLLVADYSQLEIVVLAHLCSRLFGAHGLRNAISPDSPDMHSATARFVFGEVLGQSGIANCPVDDIKGKHGWYREAVKAVRYGLNYGKGSYGFGNTLFDPQGEAIGEATAQRMIDALLAMHPEIAEYQRWVEGYVRRHKGMPSLMGRWGCAPDGDSDTDWKRRRAVRQMLNWPMQAGAQEIVMMAMVELHRRGFTMTLQVHDELHALVDEDKAEAAAKVMREVMEQTTRLDAYLKAVPSVGKDWNSCK